MGYIYKITNLINKKVYIGQTSKTISKRWGEHIYASVHQNGREWNYHLHRAIRKYEAENFQITMIEAVADDDLNDREKFWIKYYDSYNSGYNMTLGGEGSRTIEYNKIYTLWNDKYSVGEIADIIGCSDVQVREILKSHYSYSITESFRRGASRSSKIVLQYDYDCNLLNTYRSAMEASRHTGISAAQIMSICKGIGKTAGGYQWRYENSKLAISPIPYVMQYDLQNKLIAKYDSIKDAAAAVGVSSGAICGVCRGKRKTSAGYVWKYSN